MWNDNQPIYQQLRDRIMARVLDGSLPEGEAIPSIRQVATEYQINPLTVSKAYQELCDLNVIEKRRGLGMFVKIGAKKPLLHAEKDTFLHEEWPRICDRIQNLGLSPKALLKDIKEPA
jgi:GntR family transcriptional regulator